MKKLIYGGLFLVAVGTGFLACKKEITNAKRDNVANTEVSKSKSKAFDFSNEKSTRLSDEDLIAIIKGLNPNYTKLEEIQDVLLENCKLSSSVLHAMIVNPRYPDFMVETIMVLSAPITNSDLNFLNTKRPSLSTMAIVAARNIDLLGSNYAIVNTNPRQILFAKNMVRTFNCPSGCGESEIKGDNFVVLDLMSATKPLDPSEMKPCESGGKWICGTPKRVKLISTDGTSAIYLVVCTQSNDKCIKDVADAVRDFAH